MAKKNVFFSFHFKPDNWRAAQVRNAHVVEGNAPVSDNDWEAVKKGGDPAIEQWINKQMVGRECVVVLIGAETAGRKWIKYEIKQGWTDGKGVLGIHIHNLLDANQSQSTKGRNPFAEFKIGSKPMSDIVKAYDPPYVSSTNVYAHIRDNIGNWVDEAIRIRRTS